MGMQFDVAALGELLIDFTENGKSAQGNPLFEANPGGAPCNVLSMLKKLGHACAFIGKLGDDMFGKMLRDTAEDVGIDTRALILDPAAHTTLAFVHTAENGDRDFSFYRDPGADMLLREDEIPEDLIRSAQESLAAKILLIAPPQIRFTDPSCTQPFVQGTQTYARQCLEQSTVLAQYYKDIAARCGVFYADASSWDLALAFDGVHLSLEANAVFARELEKVIRRL